MRFIQYVEMRDAFMQPTDGVQLKDIGWGMRGDFEIDGQKYWVEFANQDGWFAGQAMPTWSINFYGPRGQDLTGLGNQNRVYRQLILLIRKFLEEKNPPVLMFGGYSSEQSVMYDYLEKNYLKDYTRVGGYVVRNDILQQNISHPDVQTLMSQKGNSQQMRQHKMKTREIRRGRQQAGQPANTQ